MGRRQRGVSLIELVITIVILTFGLTGIVLVFERTVLFSADPVIRHQAIAIAEAYMDEILLQSYNDPDGTDGEASRADYDDVDDYDGLGEPPTDPTGTTIAGLEEKYTVEVAVDNTIDVSGGGATVEDMARITITVSHADKGEQFTLTAYRGEY